MTYKFRVHSTTELNKYYNIIVYPLDDLMVCTCPGYKSHKYCRHIKFYKKLRRAVTHEK